MFRQVRLDGLLITESTMKIYLKTLLTSLLLCSISWLHANTDTVVVNSSESFFQLAPYVSILEDPEGVLTIEDVVGSDAFKPAEQKVPNLDITESTFWVKFTVKNQLEDRHLLVDLAYPIIDHADLYQQLGSTGFMIARMGESVPFSERTYDHQNFIYDLHIPQGSTSTYYLRVNSGQQIMLPLDVGAPTAVLLSNISIDLYNGIYFGIVMVMLLYNLFLFLSVRDNSYLYYVGYILFVGLTQASDNGYTYKILWPESPMFNDFMVTLFPSLTGTAAILFMRNFLNTRKYIPKLDQYFFGLIGLYGFCTLLNIMGMSQSAYQATQMTAMVVSLFMLIAAYRVIRKGYEPAKFFMLAWTVFLISVIAFVMKDFGVLPYNAITKHSLQIGSALELVLLSLALANKINILKREKVESQAKTVEALRENERIMREQNEMLDTKVKERTAELEVANAELNVAITDLKDAQSQLVDAEKMASLGLLTAGIAHEINNPINFVVSNINPLKRDIQDIMEVLNQYAEIKDDINLQDKLEAIEELKEDLDLEYTLQEIEDLLKGIDEGAARTADIVKSLKTFSRLDETDLKRADVNECIDSTLVLLNNSLRGQIDVVKEFDTIQPIDCYPGKLNQLFMNLIKNAQQALEVKNYENGEKPTLIVKTKDYLDEVVIHIEDNGIGMDKATMNRIFEPFFTTKDVGEGTGLGLSIGYNIVEKHNGVIEVDSTPGVGTEFVIAIPKDLGLAPDDDRKERISELKKERRNRLKEGLKNKTN